MCWGLNSHYFHIIGDKLINPIVGVYIPIIRIPIKRWEVSHPQKNATFDHGTYATFLHHNLDLKNSMSCEQLLQEVTVNDVNFRKVGLDWLNPKINFFFWTCLLKSDEQ